MHVSFQVLVDIVTSQCPYKSGIELDTRLQSRCAPLLFRNMGFSSTLTILVALAASGYAHSIFQASGSISPGGY